MSCEWKKTTLGELYEFASGLSKGAKDFGFGLPFLSFKTVFNNYFVPDKIHDLANTTAQEQKKCSIQEGDVFLTRTSETINELGMSCVALRDYPLATFNGFTKRLRPKDKTKIYPKYAAFYFRSSTFRSIVNGYTTLTTRASLNNETLHRLPMTLPNFNEQKAIGDLLFSLHNKIDLNNKIKANLETQALAIFKSWFVDFEPFQNEGFVDSEVGRIPKGWRVGTLSDIGNIIGGATPSKAIKEYYTNASSGIAWITPKDLSNNRDKFIFRGETDITELGFKHSSTRIMPQGTVLFSSRAPIGYMAIAENDVCTNQGFKSVVPNESYGTAFIYYTLKYKLGEIQNLGSGSTFKEVSGNVMKKITVLIPDTEVLNSFNGICETIFNKQRNLERQNHTLADLRDSLIPKLMNGEIKVPISNEKVVESYD